MRDEVLDSVTARIAIVKHGYVHEDSTTVDDDQVVQTCNSYRAAKIRLFHILQKTGHQKDNYYLRKEVWNGLDWDPVEGSEVIF